MPSTRYILQYRSRMSKRNVATRHAASTSKHFRFISHLSLDIFVYIRRCDRNASEKRNGVIVKHTENTHSLSIYHISCNCNTLKIPIHFLVKHQLFYIVFKNGRQTWWVNNKCRLEISDDNNKNNNNNSRRRSEKKIRKNSNEIGNLIQFSCSLFKQLNPIYD